MGEVCTDETVTAQTDFGPNFAGHCILALLTYHMVMTHVGPLFASGRVLQARNTWVHVLG